MIFYQFKINKYHNHYFEQSKTIIYIIRNLRYISFSGGSFPLPPAAAHVCTLLPPPGCFRGPFVSIELMCDVFNRIQLPDHGMYNYFKYLCVITSKELSCLELYAC